MKRGRRGVCACARACVVQCGAWLVAWYGMVCGSCGVLIGPVIAWNRTNKCVVSFRGAGVWFFSRFSGSQKMHLIWGSGCHLFHLWEMNARDAWWRKFFGTMPCHERSPCARANTEGAPPPQDTPRHARTCENSRATHTCGAYDGKAKKHK